VEDVTCGGVVDDHNLAQVRLHGSEVFDIRPVAVGAVLAVIPAFEIFTVLLEPVYHGIRVLLDRGGEDDEVVPFRDLLQDLA
jgi:hypothetical protein